MLTEDVEEELRSAFARAAAEYPDPDQARQRVLECDYRPGSRRGLAVGITAAASAAAVGLGLSAAFGPAPGPDTSTIRTTAFTLAHNADGTDTLTINPLVLFYPGALQKDLAQHGIPAKVTIDSFCSSDPAPAGFSKVMSGSQPPPGGHRHPRRHKPKATVNSGNPMVTISPAAMPAGTELSVGVFQVASGVHAGLVTALALIDTNSHTCSKAVPTKPPPGGTLSTLTVPAFPPGS